MDRVVKHPYFNDDGPVTFEYLFPISDSCLQASARFSQLFGGRSIYTSDLIQRWLENHWQSLRFSPSIQIRDRLLQEHSVHSLIVFKEFTWINFKRIDCIDSLSEYGNSVLIGIFDPYDFEEFQYLDDFREDVIEYLQYFRTTCGEIPPVMTPWLKPAPPLGKLVVDDDFWNLDTKEKMVWEGSLVVRPSNSGTYLLLRKDGQFGHSYLYQTVSITDQVAYELLMKWNFGRT